MRKTQFIELINTIKKTMVSFVSIAFFVLLGAAIFLGIDWSVTGYKYTVDNTLKKWNMHDFSLTYPYGFSEEEINVIKKLDYIDKVEGQNSLEASFVFDDKQYQAKVILLTKEIDDAHKIIGEIPTKKGEIGFERFWAENNGIKVGDTITFKHDDDGSAYRINNLLNKDLDALKEETKTEDGMLYLTTDTYKVTGLFENATYVNQYRVTYGVSSTTSIPNDCITYVSEDSIDFKAFNGYRTLLVTSNELDGLSTYDDQYKEKSKELADKLKIDLKDYTDKTNNKISTSIAEIQKEIDKQIEDGESEIKKAEQEIKDGEKQIKDGKTQLDDGKAKMQDALKQLDKGWDEYTSGVKQYNDGVAQYYEFESVYTKIRTAIDIYAELKEMPSKLNDIYAAYEATDSAIKTVLDSFESGQAVKELFEDYRNGDFDFIVDHIVDIKNAMVAIKNKTDFEAFKEAVNQLDSSKEGVAELQELVLTIDDIEKYVDTALLTYELFKIPFLSSEIENEAKKVVGAEAEKVIDFVEQIENSINLSYTATDDIIKELIRVFKPLDDLVNFVDVELNTVIKPKLREAAIELNKARAQLEAAYAKLVDGEKQYENGLKDIDKNEKKLKQAEIDLEKGKEELKDGKAELDDAKQKAADYNNELENAKSYEVTILDRNLNAGVASTSVPMDMMGSIKYTMALLFVIVGVFVCYSALSRNVYDQIIQIGTKKALGLSRGEITIAFLLYGTFATLIGCILGILLARFAIEPLILAILAKNYIVADNKYYFSLSTSLYFLLFELVVTNLTSFIACNKILKKKAIKLLQGPEDLIGKSHFYEKLPGWESLSLLTKTIINNCVNDTRRVIATLVGIAGCCSLMVCAITLFTNMNESLDYQLNNVAKFDTIVYVDTTVDGSLNNVNKVLDDMNVEYFVATYSSCAVENSKGDFISGALFVYDNDLFYDFFEVALDGERQLSTDGIAVAKAYAQHNDVNVGDNVTILDGLGEKYEPKISRIFDYYLLRVQTVMSKDAYVDVFGKEPVKNAILIKRGNFSTDEINKALFSIDGYISTFDYLDESKTMYNGLTQPMIMVIATFFVLAVVLAFLVLLNLLIMFVDEKKKELIVMMINGYSRKKAKTYIYGDTIVLTIIGVLIGIALGVSVGFATIKTFDSDCVTIMRNINIPSYLICGALTALLSTITCLIALKKVNSFKLTDLNTK